MCPCRSKLKISHFIESTGSVAHLAASCHSASDDDDDDYG
jgi:hypothetical protein